MIVDLHTHLWESLDQLGADAAASIRQMGEMPWDRPVTNVDSHRLAMEPVTYSVILGFESRYLGASISIEQISKYVQLDPGKYIGFGGVDPMNPGFLAQVATSGVAEGFVLVSAMHITASVFVNDHESGLWRDILKWLEGTVAPWDPERYRHNETGEDNAAAHLRSLTIGHEVIVPITAGKLDLGPWQRVFYGEWDGKRRKRVIVKVMGD